jgi:hypothetical protein
MNVFRLGTSLALGTLVACSDGSDGGSSGAEDIRPQLDLVGTEPPYRITRYQRQLHRGHLLWCWRMRRRTQSVGYLSTR